MIAPTKCLIRLLAVGTLALVTAGDPAWAGRPLNTDDAGIVEMGRFEFEMGIDHTKCQCHVWERCFGLTMKYGLGNGLDASVQIPFLFLKPTHGHIHRGLSDLALSLKYGFFEGRGLMPSLAIRGDVKLTTGDPEKELGSGTTDYALWCLATGGGEKWLAHVNVGGQICHVPHGGFGKIIFGAIALEYALRDEIRLVGELLGESRPDLEMDCTYFRALGGIGYELLPGVIFDVGLNLGLTGKNPRYAITVGVTVSSN